MWGGRVHWGGVTLVDLMGGATLETVGEGGGAIRMYRGMTTREREREPTTIAHTLTQITTCIYTQMNHICTKPTRQTSCISIDSKQTSHGEWVVPEWN